MMPILRTSLAATLVALLFVAVPEAQGQEMFSESRTVETFTRLEFATPGIVYLKQGDAASVRVEASSQELLDRVRTGVRGDELVINAEDDGRSWFEKLFGDDEELNVYVTMPDVRAVSISGTGEIIAETVIQSEKLDLRISGTGDIEAELDVDRLESEINGTGDAKVSGRAARHRIRISGTGDVEAIDLQTEETDVEISGTGDARVHATKSLRANVSGLGDVTYRGTPDDLSVESSGLGDIEREDG